VQIAAIVGSIDLAQFALGMGVEKRALLAERVGRAAPSAVRRGAAMPASSRSLVPWQQSLLEPSWRCLRRYAFLFQFFGLVIGGERVDDGIEAAIHHDVELMQRQADAVIGDAICGKLYVRIFSLRSPCRPCCGARRPTARVVFRARSRRGATAARAGLWPCLLICDFSSWQENDQAGGQVRDADGGVGACSRTGRRGRKNKTYRCGCPWPRSRLRLRRLGQHRDRNGGGVDAALLLGLRHALHAVHDLRCATRSRI